MKKIGVRIKRSLKKYARTQRVVFNWKYGITNFTTNGYIHPVAIASTLLGERDPRIEDEVDTLIRKYLEEND